MEWNGKRINYINIDSSIGKPITTLAHSIFYFSGAYLICGANKNI